MRRGTVVGLLLLTISAATPAWAQPADAGALVKHGLALRRERRDAEALEEFRRAYAIDPAPRTLAQIALAEQALGRWVDAETDLQAALRAADDPWIASNRRVLETGLSTIRGHIGSLDVEADVAGAELWVNGARVGALPLAAPLRVEAGSVIVEVRATGYAPARRITSVDPGGSAREAVRLVPLAPPSPIVESPSPPAVPGKEGLPPPPPPVTPPRVVPLDRPMRAASFVVLGAGVLGLAAGSYFGVRTFSTKNERDQACVGVGGTCPATGNGLALDAEARTLAVRSTAWFAGGLTATAIGAGLFWLSRPREIRTGTAALRPLFAVGAGGVAAGVWTAW
jgi:hypothetical protein